jgi:hypothetical protein
MRHHKSIIIIISFAILALALAAGCSRKKPGPQNRSTFPNDPHAGLNIPPPGTMNPHGSMMSGGLDLEALGTNLPDGWTRTEPSSSMRLLQISLAPAKGDAQAAELAVFHFPGTGGSSAANIERWQNQFNGPKGEPGPQVAKTDTMMVGLLTVITTDVSGTQLAAGVMTGGSGPDADVPNSRMIASVIETPSGNWFIKAAGPAKTMAAHENKIRTFIQRVRLTNLPQS